MPEVVSCFVQTQQNVCHAVSFLMQGGSCRDYEGLRFALRLHQYYAVYIATASVVRGPSFSAATGKDVAAETARARKVAAVSAIKQDQQRMRIANAE
jgi:hypothetical protein